MRLRLHTKPVAQASNGGWPVGGLVALCLGAVGLGAIAAASAAGGPPVGTEIFTDRRNPPPYRKLSDAEFTRSDLGLAVFNTQWVVAGTPNAGRRDGVGPLFNSPSCDACHNDGARGVGPTEDGPAPTSLVIQLAAPSSTGAIDPVGDPAYGRVFNTAALAGVMPEGVVLIHYSPSDGHYADGAAWSLRVPHYELTDLHYGPLAPTTIVKPRLAPPLFGVGLLEAAVVNGDAGGGAGARAGTGAGARADAGVGARTDASASARADAGAATAAGTTATAAAGRFGWQATALSVRDQTARAFAREMGLTSADIATDDCTKAETDCPQQPNGGSPEVSAELFDAVMSFQQYLAVPASPSPHTAPNADSKIFAELGCSACHSPQLPVALNDDTGKSVPAVIAPYTDLRLHDLGTRLADEDISGKKIPGKWRTAPLWGLGYRMSREHHPTFLHDGRARSAEEAILWHDGEAASARRNFEQLPLARRKALLHWIETL